MSSLKEIKEVQDYTVKEFKELPSREWNEDVGEIDSLVILPLSKLHDSGYGLMDFIAVVGNVPVCRLSGCSDVLHIGGITSVINKEQTGFTIDCLPKSKLLRLFVMGKKMIVGSALSSFEVFVSKNNLKNKTKVIKKLK